MGFRHNFLIGLGGTGGAALKAFRAETVERQGEYQNMLQQGRRFEYLYLDSNAVDVACATQWKHHGQHIGLVQGTQALLLSLPKNATAEEIANHPQVESWIGENGVEDIVNAEARKIDSSGAIQGAGQRRRYGRVLAAVNADAIRQRIKDGVCELSKGLADFDRRVTFHVFASAGGGTGSGCLVDVLTLLPRLCHDFNILGKIVAYLFVGGAEAKSRTTGYFYTNEYATLRDVNALMANRYCPYRTLMPEGRTPFHNYADPIDAVYISTEENGVDLEAQVKRFAASCFDMISFVPSVDSSTCRDFSGADLYELESGEESVVELDPRFNKDVVNQHFPNSEGAVPLYERSYRFQTLSTVRAKHPSVELHGVLACALGEKVYDRWLRGGLLHRSSRDTSLDGNADIYAYGEQDLLLSQLDAESREKLSGEHKAMLDSYKKTDRSVAAFTEVGERNAAIIRRCLEQTVQDLTGGESVNACRRLAQDDRNTIIDMLEKRRRGQSDAKGESWGIGNIRDYLCEVRAYLQKKIAQHRMPGCEELGEGVQRICSARASLGFMKKCFTFTSRKLYRQLREECSSSLERCCDARLEAFRNLRHKFLLEMVQKDIEAYEEIFRVLESQQQAARERRDAYLKRLPFWGSPENPEFHIPDKNIYLWNSENLEQHLDFYGDDVRCDDAVSQAVSACEDQWSTVVGRFLDSGRYADGYASKGARALVYDLLREESGLLWVVSDRIHAELCDQQRIERLNKVYYETIYDYLADKDAQFRNMLLDMLMVKTMDRSAAIAPCEHGGGTVWFHDIQSDPMCSVCLGMLSAGRLRSSAAAAVHADMSTLLTTRLQSMDCLDRFLGYEHNIDGTEIRIARVEYNMPLRFFCVMEYLDQCYKKAQDEGLTEALYYANIDDAGMLDPSPDRPDLLPELDPIKHTAREELRKQLQEKNTH